MKLGATITSERGKFVTKTGNEYLNINLNNEKGNIVYRVHYTEKSIVILEDDKCIFQKLNGNLKHGTCSGKHDTVHAIINCKDCSDTLDTM